jgi:ketosteroid isomerase-like protein
MPATDVEAFLESTLPGQIHAERALHNGDVTPRLSTWSQRDPVTLFGAAVPCRTGWPAVRAVFEWLVGRFASCDDYAFELIASGVGGDLAYTVGIERYRATAPGGAQLHNTLRVTHVYRREAEGWKIVHRHGDHLPADASARTG